MPDGEVVPQPRIDVRARTATGDGEVRLTHFRGTVWFGGRPEARGGIVISRGGGMAPTGERLWLPDSLAYRSDQVATVTLAASAALQSTRNDAQILNVSAELAPHPEHPELSYVLLTISAAAQLPLGVSYQVVASAPVDAVAG